ncbi:MAG: ATP-dependent Clp protease ATP-binding subunit, partial [Oscillospiraceae bacterium]
MLCIRCNKRPAIVFVQKLENGEQKSEGYCLSCAREIGIKPVDDLMKQFGISEQDLSGVEDRFASMLGDMDPAELMQNLALQAGEGAEPNENSDDDADGEDKDFTPGGSATLPFGIFGGKKKDDDEGQENVHS